jgi:hypothetical protein
MKRVEMFLSPFLTMPMFYGGLNRDEERLRSLKRSKKTCKQELISLSLDAQRAEALLKRIADLDREIRSLQ